MSFISTCKDNNLTKNTTSKEERIQALKLRILKWDTKRLGYAGKRRLQLTLNEIEKDI